MEGLLCHAGPAPQPDKPWATEVAFRADHGNMGRGLRQHGRSTMPLSHLEHFLIQSADLEATKDWYVRVLGMRVGPSPDFRMPVYWLYIGDRDVLHLTVGGANVSEQRLRYLGQQSQATHGSGVVD